MHTNQQYCSVKLELINNYKRLIIYVLLLLTSIASISHADILDDLRSQANSGKSSAQFDLGWTYMVGGMIEKDLSKAVYWYGEAAKQGDSYGQFWLGSMYLKGDGVLQDSQKAIYWFSKAAEQGNITAQFMLGWLYDRGSGVKKDYDKSIYWYKKAADQGLEKAKYNLEIKKNQ